jgi:hypothetical protein
MRGRKSQRGRPWTKEEDEKLASLIDLYGIKFSAIARELKSRTLYQIRKRWAELSNPTFFSSIEETMLFRLYDKHKLNWAEYAKILTNKTPEIIQKHFYFILKCFAYRNLVLKNGEGDLE